eukprot:TRINITY_DN557_c0_g1_i2.p1 TRINITY_DN557_c0_g1~~TRINITY_DN557_c0_g1_i2.p1  ORF type:complete len:130 (+),score=25.62 TRINITY_DN557_c0_g1_i2:144-533(+)
MLRTAFVLCCLTAVTFAATCNPNPCGAAEYTDIATQCSTCSSSWSQGCCQCIAKAESGGNYHACNNNTNGSLDIGLWQINQSNWASCSGGSAPCTISANCKCAKAVWGWGGNTWKDWSTCSTCGCCSKP